MNGFLSNAGRDENSSTGFQEWANVYLKVPRALGITTLVLDHTGWDTSHSRGTSRKPDEFDIVWKVGVKRRFSRRDTGQLKLKLLKDRDSLVDRDGFDIVIGGEPFQFQVEAADSTKNDLSSGQEKTFALVTQNSNNHMGTPRKSINELFNGSKSRADKNIKSLVKMDLIYQPEGSTDYWIVDPVSYSSSESPEDSDPNSASDPSAGLPMASGEGVPGSRSFRSGPQDPAHQTTPHGSVRMGDFDNRSDVDGGGIKTEGESVSRIENHADATLIVKTKDILEAIEHLNYNQRRIQILKSVASVLLAHPMLPATTKKERLDDDIAKILRLVEKEGVKINRKAFITALQVLEDEFSFLKVLEEKVRWLVNGKSSCDFDEEWAS